MLVTPHDHYSSPRQTLIADCPALLLVQNPAAMKQLVEAEDADVVCLQETKLQDKAVEQMEALMGLKGWHHAWNCSTAKKGYSGTAIISK